MARGRDICNTLKAIRKQIADANGIAYSPEECHFTGECKGTCPKCEQDVRDLEYELRRRQIAGKAIKVVGIAAGLVALNKMTEKQRLEIVFGIRPKLKLMNQKLKRLIRAVKYTRLSDVWAEIDYGARSEVDKPTIVQRCKERWRRNARP